jgi:hypothetical protein
MGDVVAWTSAEHRRRAIDGRRGLASQACQFCLA